MNLIDSKIGRHQATYIPVSNSLLKSSLTRGQTPTAAPRPISILNRFLHERTEAPDDKNTTIIKNMTSSRHKRDIQELTTATTNTTASDDDAAAAAAAAAEDLAKTTESTPPTSQTIVNELNENIDRDETIDAIGEAASNVNSDARESIANSSYPSFHVTYWMFYPYSQVKCTFTARQSVNQFFRGQSYKRLIFQ